MTQAGATEATEPTNRIEPPRTVNEYTMDLLISVPITVVATCEADFEAKVAQRLPEGAFVVVDPVVPIPEEEIVLGAGPVYNVRDHLTPKGHPRKRGAPRPRLPGQPKIQAVPD